MENTPSEEKHFFQLTLSAAGADYIKKMLHVSRWTILLIFLIGLLYSCWNILRILANFKGELTGYTGNMRIYVMAQPWFSMLLVLGNILTTFVYFRFFRLCNEAIEAQDAEQFNHSFRILWIQGRLGLLVMVFALLVEIMNTYWLSDTFRGLIRIITR